MISPAAFFDLDGTLTTLPSCELRLYRHLLREGAIGPRQWLACVAFFARWLFVFGPDVGRKNKAFLAGLEVAEIERIADLWVGERLDGILLAEVVREMEQCRSRGLRLVLLTGTPDFLARPIARQLRMDDLIATRCAERGGQFTAAPPLLHPLGREKLALAQGWCDRQGVSLAQCAACGDSWQDRFLLGAVGDPVVVDPSQRLARYASERHWRIVHPAREGGDEASTPRPSGPGAG